MSSEMRETIGRLQAENDLLRAKLANGPGPCVYCELPKAEWGRCQHGFPGCGRADDATLCPHFGAELQFQRELDPRPLTKEFIKSIAVGEVTENVFDICKFESSQFYCQVWFADDGNWDLNIDVHGGHFRYDLPTVGMLYTACRMLGLTVAEPVDPPWGPF